MKLIAIDPLTGDFKKAYEVSAENIKNIADWNGRMTREAVAYQLLIGSTVHTEFSAYRLAEEG